MSGKALTFSPSFFLSDVLDLLDSPHGDVSPPVVIGSTALARRLILAKLTKVGRKYFRAEVTWLCLGRGVAELDEGWQNLARLKHWRQRGRRARLK